jgi:CubicO group peptidase (beta-lactamase class C family)
MVALRYGTPEEAGLRGGGVAEIAKRVHRDVRDRAYPGAVVIAGRHGIIAVHEAAGYAERYASYTDGQAVELPKGKWTPVRRDTIFDLASLTKLFTTVLVMRLAEAGRVEIDAPVAAYVPEFALPDKRTVTTRHLLTHTSGLPAWKDLHGDDETSEQRLAGVLGCALEAAPGRRRLYSDLGFIVLGRIAERVTGRRLDEELRESVTGPLRMADTMFRPPPALRERIAATEYQPRTGRGMIRGSVHDENAWSLSGVAGHAGMFGTAHDLAVFADTLLRTGNSHGPGVLRPETIARMIHEDLGVERNQRWYMGALASPLTFGQTGFTGTSLVADLRTQSFVILLTNRVHPSRDRGPNNASRVAVANALATALPD